MSASWCDISKDFSAGLPVSRRARQAGRRFLALGRTCPRTTVLSTRRAFRRCRAILQREPGTNHDDSHRLPSLKAPTAPSQAHRLTRSVHCHCRCVHCRHAQSAIRHCYTLHWLVLRPCANDRFWHLHLTLTPTPTSGAPSLLPKIHHPGRVRVCVCTPARRCKKFIATCPPHQLTCIHTLEFYVPAQRACASRTVVAEHAAYRHPPHDARKLVAHAHLGPQLAVDPFCFYSPLAPPPLPLLQFSSTP